MKREQIYKTVSSKKGKNVTIRPDLCFYNPEEVYNALIQNHEIIEWLNFIANHYSPPTRKILLIYPCSNEKPYHRSRSYKRLFKTLSRLGDERKNIHLVSISEPFGLVPEEFYEKKETWYDCPGLFEWWCNKYNQPYSKEYVDKSIERLATYIAEFLKKAKSRNSYSRMIAFVRTYTSQLERKDDHTHRRIIEKAAQIANVNVGILPDSRLVSGIVRKSGRIAWDMYGVSHPMAQEHLLKYLKGVLNEKWYMKLKRLFYGLPN